MALIKNYKGRKEGSDYQKLLANEEAFKLFIIAFPTKRGISSAGPDLYRDACMPRKLSGKRSPVQLTTQ